VRAFWSPSRERYVAPSTASFHRVLSEIAPEMLDEALRRFIDQNRSPQGAVALDGKATAAEWMRGKDSERMLVAAVEHASGLVCGQEACDSAGGEIEGVRELLRHLDIEDRVVTLDALHTQRKTARLIVERGGFYLMTVKGNRRELLDDLAAFDWDAKQVAATEYATTEKAHGRIETRRCRVIGLDLVAPEHVSIPHRRQAFRIERERHLLRSDKTSAETVYGVTSLGPERASASELLNLNRGHWEIENRLHYVRDFTYDEDHNRVRAKRLRRNLACLANAAISPASRTPPSRSCDSTDVSTTCRRPTATSQPARATPCAK